MANNIIRGITVEIGGNTTKLGDALQDSEKKTRSLQVELRNIDKALKFNPQNVELLTQKQEVLTQSVEETTTKLNKLKEAEEDIAKKAEAGIINEEEFRAFKREIVETESKLEHYEQALTDVKTAIKNVGTDKAVKETKEYKDAVKEAEDAIGEFKDSVSGMFDVVTGASVAVGGALVTAGGYCLNLSTEFDKAFNTLVTQTGASREEMDALNESMENIYANNFGESIEDVAESMAKVKQNTGYVGKELEQTTEYALLMRDTFGFEVEESIRAVNSMMDQFGITSEEAYNLIAQGAQKGLNQNGDLLDVINEYSFQFSNAFYSAEDMFNMLVNGAEEGTWSVDKLGDAFKEFDIRVSDGTVADALLENHEILGMSKDEAKALNEEIKYGGEEAYTKLLEQIMSVEDYTERYKLGVSAFGTMWEDLGEDAIVALLNTQGEISTTSDALNSINDQKYDDIGSAIEGLGRTFQTEVALPLGEELKPIVEDLIGYVQENGPQIKDIIFEGVEKVKEFVNFVRDNGPEIVGILAGIGTALAVFKIGGIIASAVGAIQGFIGLVQTGSTVMGALNTVMSMNPIVLIIGLVAGLVVAFITLWNNCDAFREFWINLWEKIKEFCGDAVEKIKVFFTETLPQAIDKMVEWFQQLPGKIQEKLTAVIERVKTWASNMGTKAREVGSKFLTSIIDFFKQLPGKIWNFLVNVVTKLVTWRVNMITKAIEVGTQFISKIISFISQLPGKIWTWLLNVVNKVASWGSEMASKGRESARQLLEAVVNKIKEIPGKILSVGGDIVSGLWNGISNKVEWIKGKIEGFVGDVTGWLKKFFKIESPSKLMRDEIGRYIAEGIGVGIEENEDKPLDALKKLGTDMLNQDINLNGATINRRLTTTFASDLSGKAMTDNLLLSKLDDIYERLNRLQIVLDTGTLVGETIDKIDAGLATRQLLSARGV